MHNIKISLDHLELDTAKKIEIIDFKFKTIINQLTPSIMSFTYKNGEVEKKFKFTIVNINMNLSFNKAGIKISLSDEITNEDILLDITFKLTSASFTCNISKGLEYRRVINENNISGLISEMLEKYL